MFWPAKNFNPGFRSTDVPDKSVRFWGPLWLRRVSHSSTQEQYHYFDGRGISRQGLHAENSARVSLIFSRIMHDSEHSSSVFISFISIFGDPERNTDAASRSVCPQRSLGGSARQLNHTAKWGRNPDLHTIFYKAHAVLHSSQ